MDTRAQHRANVRDERRWQAEARHDEMYLERRAKELRLGGDLVRARFMEHEAHIAGAFAGHRLKILNEEKRKAGL